MILAQESVVDWIEHFNFVWALLLPNDNFGWLKEQSKIGRISDQLQWANLYYCLVISKFAFRSNANGSTVRQLEFGPPKAKRRDNYPIWLHTKQAYKNYLLSKLPLSWSEKTADAIWAIGSGNVGKIKCQQPWAFQETCLLFFCRLRASWLWKRR